LQVAKLITVGDLFRELGNLSCCQNRAESVACRGGGRTGRRPWASKAAGNPKSEITKI